MVKPFERFVARHAMAILHPIGFKSMGKTIHLSGAGILAAPGDFGLYVQG
jgi:hypothetical protein